MKIQMRKLHMTQELNKARQLLIDEYIKALSQNEIPWHQEWHAGNAINGITKKPYRGINQLLLYYIGQKRGYTDPRWVTFNQAHEKGWKVEAGSKGVPIEYWSIYDKLQKKNISITEATRIIEEDEEREKDMSWKTRTYTVFNAHQIEGIPEYQSKTELSKVKNPQPFIDNLIKEMGVRYVEEGDHAFYRPNDDSVHIPPNQTFEDEYSYHATRLHELAHATGHTSRLNRDIQHTFGSVEYAKEELRAEIASSFIAADLDIRFDQKHLDNHKAYIQNWISVLKKDPNELFRAIKDATGIYDYVVKTGKLEIFQIQEEMKSTAEMECDTYEVIAMVKINDTIKEVKHVGKDVQITKEAAMKELSEICQNEEIKEGAFVEMNITKNGQYFDSDEAFMKYEKGMFIIEEAQQLEPASMKL